MEIFLLVYVNLSNDPVDGIFYEKNNEYSVHQNETFIFEKTETGWKHNLEEYTYSIDYDIWDESFINDKYPN